MRSTTSIKSKVYTFSVTEYLILKTNFQTLHEADFSKPFHIPTLFHALFSKVYRPGCTIAPKKMELGSGPLPGASPSVRTLFTSHSNYHSEAGPTLL